MVSVKTTERPIRLSPEFIRAVLCGEKTQHREIICNCACNCVHLGKLLGDWGLSIPPHRWDGDEQDGVGWNWADRAKRPVAGDFVEQWQTDVDDHASGHGPSNSEESRPFR